MKPLTLPIKDHGKICGVVHINLSEYHCHKITVSKGRTILPLKVTIDGMQAMYELEIEVE